MILYNFLKTILSFVVAYVAGVQSNNLDCPSPCVCSKTSDGGFVTKCLNAGFVKFPDGIKSHTATIDLSGNPLAQLEAYDFRARNLSSIQVAFMQRCSIRKIDRHAFSGLPKLYELNLSHNLLSSVPTHALDSLPQLRELVLTGNPVLTLENNAFVAVSQLTRLELADAQIKTIEPRAFYGLELLEWLKLDGNLLESISASALSSLRNVRRMDLQHNPWHCSCAIRPLKGFVTLNKVVLSLPPQCLAPLRLKGRFWQRLPVEELACTPFVTIENPEVEIFIGEDIKLDCHVQASPPAAIMWLHNDVEIHVHAQKRRVIEPVIPDYDEVESHTLPILRKESKKVQKGGKHVNKRDTSGKSADRRISIFEDGTTEKISELHITRVSKEDLGNYTCVGVNRGGKTMAKIDISVDPRDTSAYPALKGLGGLALLCGALAIICFLIYCCICSVKVSKNRDGMSEDGDIDSQEASNFLRDIKKANHFAFVDENVSRRLSSAVRSPPLNLENDDENSKKDDDSSDIKEGDIEPQTFEASLRQARLSLTESDHRGIPQRLGVLKRRTSNASDFSETSVSQSHASLCSLSYDEQRKRGVERFRLAGRRGSADIYVQERHNRGIRFKDEHPQKRGRLDRGIDSVDSVSPSGDEAKKPSKYSKDDFPDLIEDARYYRDKSHDSSNDDRPRKERTLSPYRFNDSHRDSSPSDGDYNSSKVRRVSKVSPEIKYLVNKPELEDFEYWLEQQKKDALDDLIYDRLLMIGKTRNHELFDE